ncbi:MAG: hypothetical protein EOP83_12560 [Verrucomicrobiaceae bacterium]|nr:MAG: hypothetical protein EOP83_12560 [Verrucomicrobiaceae bacterium]
MRRFFAGWCRCLNMAAAGIALVGSAWAQMAKPATLPGAPQLGVGCAFYANVPALTKVSGIQIVDETRESRSFVASIYGLRRGDFEFRRAFDKEVFFQLFGIPSKAQRHDYADLPRGDLLVEAERLVTGVFKLALDGGDFISVRARGVYGGPHNVLLLGNAGGKYQIHDPLTGAMRSLGQAELARTILSESKQGTKVKKRYFSAYHMVTVRGSASRGNPLTIAHLSEFLSLRLTDAQQGVLRAKLVTAETSTPSNVEEIVKSFPAIDFAVITKTIKDDVKLVSAIDRELPAKSLHGAVNLAKLSLTSYQIGARDLLPVWWIDGRPCVITAYAKAWEEGGEATVTLFTAKEQFQTMRVSEALAKLKASGPLIGYVEVTRKEKATSPLSIEEDR